MVNKMARLTAKRLPLNALKNGEYVITEGRWESNYVEVPNYGKVSRVAVYGVVIHKYVNKVKEFCSINIDDFTDDIRVVGFKGMAKTLESFERGDIVLIVGKIRKDNNDNLYLFPEIARKVPTDFMLLNTIENFKSI